MGLDMVELVLAIEDEFDIYIRDGEWENLSTPNDIARYIDQHSQITKENILKRVIEISSEQLNIPISKIDSNSRYLEDLCVK